MVTAASFLEYNKNLSPNKQIYGKIYFDIFQQKLVCSGLLKARSKTKIVS